MSHFDHAANEWDSEGKIKLMATLAGKTKERLGLNKKVDILDFGTGTGLFGLAFFDQAKSLLGVDVSEGMLKVFDQKTQKFDHIQSQLHDLEKKDSLDREFDLIVSSMAFHHLDDPKAMLITLAKHLRPGGSIALVDLEPEDGSFHPDPEGMGVKHFGFSEKTLRDWAETAQLSLEVMTINEMEKEGQNYKQFLALFKK